MKRTTLLLLMPLACASLGLADWALPQTGSPPTWQTQKITDDVSSISFTRFTLAGQFTASPGQAANRPALVVDCIPGDSAGSKGKLLVSSLQVGTKLKVVYVEPEEIHAMSYYPKVAVQLRTDDASQGDENWSPGTDNMSISVGKESLKKILRAHSASITASDEHGSPLAMRFDLSDSKPIENACNLD